MIIVNDLMRPEQFLGIRGVIFDCDGVLVDSLQANLFYYNWFRSQFGLPPMDPEEERFTHTRNVFDSIRRIIPEEKWEEAFALRDTFDYRQVLPHINPEPGIFPLISSLRDLGVKMAVNTSRTNTTDMLLSHLGMVGYFHPVVSTADVSRPKPHAEGVRLILDAWRLEPYEIAFIGDSSVDQATAGNAGVEFWSYKNPRLTAALYVPDFPSLQRAFERAHREAF